MGLIRLHRFDSPYGHEEFVRYEDAKIRLKTLKDYSKFFLASLSSQKNPKIYIFDKYNKRRVSDRKPIKRGPY